MPNDPPADPEPFDAVATPRDAGLRLDQFLAQRLPKYSRGAIRRMIDLAGVTVDGRPAKPSYRLRGQERVAMVLVAGLPAADGPRPEPIPLEVLFEDDHLVAVNKPPGMVVHPARGHWSGTLASALAFRYQRLSQAGGPHRPGIVHRLDRDTTGVIVVARTEAAHHALASQFAARTVDKRYRAIVRGVPDRDRDVIRQPVGVHPRRREKMAIRSGHSTSRDARTDYRVLERFSKHALLELRPRTGRTHQIRVHLASIGHPVLCDRLYGGLASVTRGELQATLADGHDDQQILLTRQALHALRIGLKHPVSGEFMVLEAPMPADMTGSLKALREQPR